MSKEFKFVPPTMMDTSFENIIAPVVNKKENFNKIIREALEKFGIKIKSSNNIPQNNKININNSIISVVSHTINNEIVDYFEELNKKMNELRDKIDKNKIIGKINLNKNILSILNHNILNKVISSVKCGFSIIGMKLSEYDLSKLKVPRNLKAPNKLGLVSKELLEMRKKQEEALKKKKELEDNKELELENNEKVDISKEREYVPTLKANNKPYNSNAFASVGVIYIILGVIYTFIEFMVLLYSIR